MPFLGIDVGTGGTRAVVVDKEGKVIASASSEHQPFRAPHPGWAEQDPEDWWRAAQEAINGAISAAVHAVGEAGAKIEAVGLTGQMHGAVMLDAAGDVLRPSLIWCDQRTGPQCDWLHAQIGRERLIELTCNPALPNFTLTKLLWVKEHEPEIFSRIAHVMCPKDYVRYRLTGTFAIDVHEASGTLLLDVTNRKWSAEVARVSGINEAWLPPLFESQEVCAHVSATGAADTGLTKGTPVVAGAGDQGAGAVGMGILKPGAVSATIGTSGVVFAATDKPTKDPGGRLHTFCHAVPGRWHVMGVTQSAGLSLRWFRDTFASEESYDELSAAAAKIPAGSDGLLYAPYLLGERTPHLDSHATRSLRRHHRWTFRGTLHPCRARGSDVLAARHLYPLRRTRHSRQRSASRRRWRPRSALASDSDRYLRPSHRSPHRRRRRRLWSCAACRGWRWSMARHGYGLRTLPRSRRELPARS